MLTLIYTDLGGHLLPYFSGVHADLPASAIQGYHWLRQARQGDFFSATFLLLSRASQSFRCVLGPPLSLHLKRLKGVGTSSSGIFSVCSSFHLKLLSSKKYFTPLRDSRTFPIRGRFVALPCLFGAVGPSAPKGGKVVLYREGGYFCDYERGGCFSVP